MFQAWFLRSRLLPFILNHCQIACTPLSSEVGDTLCLLRPIKKGRADDRFIPPVTVSTTEEIFPATHHLNCCKYLHTTRKCFTFAAQEGMGLASSHDENVGDRVQSFLQRTTIRAFLDTFSTKYA